MQLGQEPTGNERAHDGTGFGLVADITIGTPQGSVRVVA
jgi:hypothetical protein